MHHIVNFTDVERHIYKIIVIRMYRDHTSNTMHYLVKQDTKQQYIKEKKP